MVLSSLLTDQQLCVLLPFCSTRKEDLKGLHFQRQPLLFSVFSRSPEWESNDIMIPLIHVHAVSRFFFSSVQESLFLGQYLTIPLITQLLHNLTLSNPTYFLLQSIVSPVSSFQFPSKLFFFFPDFVNFYQVQNLALHRDCAAPLALSCFLALHFAPLHHLQ